MSGKYSNYVITIYLLLSLLFSEQANADIIFEWPEGPLAARSREASARILESIARAYEALAFVERDDEDATNENLQAARMSSDEAIEIYQVLVNIAGDARILYDDMSDSVRGRVDETFQFYKVELPKNEVGLARLAVTEAETFRSSLNEVNFQFNETDHEVGLVLLRAINRMSFLGVRASDIARFSQAR